MKVGDGRTDRQNDYNTFHFLRSVEANIAVYSAIPFLGGIGLPASKSDPSPNQFPPRLTVQVHPHLVVSITDLARSLASIEEFSCLGLEGRELDWFIFWAEFVDTM
ncbi:hypothetical protein JTE90_018479 [Oedothorax gibbosus]|uniref:Uncharacterized protein n=1 Tax=Oedothorax gibbosus TaxID=931172 RepID=A0AAV6UFX6_9ARAC|nr:hypothetical protein JTE90_018479 [Oedothorax gibbosus]